MFPSFFSKAFAPIFSETLAILKLPFSTSLTGKPKLSTSAPTLFTNFEFT